MRDYLRVNTDCVEMLIKRVQSVGLSPDLGTKVIPIIP